MLPKGRHTTRRGYSHVTVLKFCCLPWCSASREFVSDSRATCSVQWTPEHRSRYTVAYLRYSLPEFIKPKKLAAK